MKDLDSLIKKGNTRFENMIIEVVLKTIKVEGQTVTLSFYSENEKSYYNKKYNIEENKGVIDFNRVMNSLGGYNNNYEVWLKEIINQAIPIEISINSAGYIRYVKKLHKEVIEKIAKSIILNRIEGLSKEDYDFLMTMDLNSLMKELQ